MAHEYFVLARSLWQGDTWSPIAGPMSKKEAEKVAEEKAHDGWSKPVWSEQHQAYWAPTQNLTRVMNTMVLSKSAMKRKIGINYHNALEEVFRVQEEEAFREEMMEHDESTRQMEERFRK